MGGQSGTRLTFSMARELSKDIYIWNEQLRKLGLITPAVASGSAFLWVQSQPQSDALIRARSFVPNFRLLAPLNLTKFSNFSYLV